MGFFLSFFVSFVHHRLVVPDGSEARQIRGPPEAIVGPRPWNRLSMAMHKGEAPSDASIV